MDHDNKKVFETGVKRNSLILENNLYEIIQRDVAKPILSKIRDDVEDITFNFIPSGGKFYIPKKKSKLKVLTIRDLRVMYEEDILQTLPNELEKQQKLLLRKIKHGFAKDENTRSIAINLLKSNNPISRLSWQMLMNLNPEDKIHSSQYILWDGKCIRLNGSTGGRNKFICNFDVYRGMNKDICRKTTSTRSKLLNKKRCLLRASLDVRFKPGPLSKKKRLDYSYQKYNVGEVKLVKLPKPGLHIQPMYGTPIEPTVKTFLQSLREDDGTISAKWAEFAVSMLGKVTNQVVHIENEDFITFNLNYKYNQNHILMRQDLGSFQGTINDNLISQELPPCTIFNESTLTSEVRAVVDEIVDAVEISLNKDLNYPAFDEPRDILTTSKTEIPTQGKEKVKRRYGELDRLDVTVIRLSESHKKNVTKPCQQTFCSLGCICDSLECNYNLKDHCGRVDCMFICKCDFSNYKFTDSLDGDNSQLYPGLYYLDQKINGKLSKEEQKFHQTVILKDDKSILLKSNRRNWKATQKYADFYNNMRLRSEIKNKKMLSIVVTKLNCRNIEPWCMVHNLYKCFCKGKFTESLTYDASKNEQKHLTNEVGKDNEVLSVPDVTQKESTALSITEISHTNTDRNIAGLTPYFCSRVLPYKGRNHDIKYYKTTNKKILEMEKHDIRLQAKMINILNQSYGVENTEEVNENMTEVNENIEEVVENTEEVPEKSMEVNENSIEGPYEKDEPLGIEALRRPVIFPSKNKTRGMWITVNKVDNAEVINNPLSFMPSFNKGRDQVITFGNDGCSDSNYDITPSTSADDQQLANENSAKSLVKNPKFVKPVKINKADCFKLPLKILTKPFPRCIKKRGKFIQENKSPTDTSLEDDMVSLPKETEEKIIESSNVTNNSEFNELLAKIPPQIKITNIASLCGLKSSSGKLTNSKRPEKGMFVLKPEEINERLAFNYFRLLQPDEINESSTELPTAQPHTIPEDSATICSMGENSFNYATVLSAVQDSLGCPANSSEVVDSLDTTPICSGDENSLESTAIYSPLTTDVCVISDEEDSNNFSSTSSWKEIWIMCTNIKNLGWVPGRRNEENKLSFRFPGFAFTDFYEEEVAFNKINQVFMRKVYVPKNITMKWRVVENVADVNVEDELNLNYLNADYVLTKHGLVHKNSLVFRGRKRIQEDNNLWSSKKIRIDDENESDVDKIDIEYINLPEDKDNSDVDDVLGDEMKNDDDKKGSDNVDKKEINNDTVFYKNIQDEDNSLFEDKEKMEEYRKVFGCAPAIASMSTRMKQLSTREVLKLDSAD
ncbi:uncharacterized protein LOC106708888 [Papilio machaon]|uniref:uncharacterized protein LOC106708888 n=1 Tax=Papilio machaon TaxID=76193 RepID=UPI001E6646AB|nr:uncharacterized protein LOC106708888 [Papilio machaon]